MEYIKALSLLLLSAAIYSFGYGEQEKMFELTPLQLAGETAQSEEVGTRKTRQYFAPPFFGPPPPPPFYYDGFGGGYGGGFGRTRVITRTRYVNRYRVGGFGGYGGFYG